MPKETFWDSSTAVEGDGSEPVLTVAWMAGVPGVQLNGVEFDRSGVNRLIKTLRKARDRTDALDLLIERDEQRLMVAVVSGVASTVKTAQAVLETHIQMRDALRRSGDE